ncbi:MAG: metallophosphoesterase, partial [Acidobacteriota bacterium]
MAKEGPRVVRWLHLSDLHLRSESGWERRKMLTGLVDHLATLREKENIAPDIVCVTGDIAFSGKRDEYDQAAMLFKRIGEAVGHDPKTSGRWFLVPGNHDVDRTRIKRFDGSILASLETQDAIEELLRDDDLMAPLGRRLDAYYDFTERLLGAARRTDPTRPWRADVVELGDDDTAADARLRIGVLQLNTAWAGGGSDEKGNLLVGGYQVEEALDQVADAHVKLALVHHPLTYLRDQDASEVRHRLTRPDGVHALLHGHLHDASSTTSVDPDGELLMLGAGAVYEGPNDQRRGYTLGEFDLGASEGHVRLFAASPKGFWAADTLAYAKAPAGVWTFPLPAELRSEGDNAPGDDEASADTRVARRRTLVERYRRAVADVYGRARFIGMADRSKRRDVAIGELFVPLQLRVPTMGDKQPGLSTAEMLGRLLIWPDADKPEATAPRMVVLGDPGSGKTTLTKYVAALVAGDHAIDGLDVDTNLLPLLLPFREFVNAAENGQLSLVDFLVHQARETLQMRVDETFFDDALDTGNAVVLLDGLDEVGSEGAREAAVQKVRAFLGQHPRVPALVTSRIAGYDRAPLPKDYDELRLEPFDDDTLQHFVRIWYTSQEDRADERARKIADLQAALQIRPRVRELARNPLLATLIALVHRYEATLPGERAALYDKVVETLLKTWPAQAGRSFPELDADLQRAELETLALQLQEGREARRKETKGKDEGIVLARAALIDQLFRNLRVRMSGREDESLRGMIARWVDYLVEGTGVLVEQTPGVFAFFHLSLLEYLAACALLRDKRAAQRIGEHFHLQTWRETCLLAIGSQATDAAFLDDVFKAIDRTKHPQRWSFLLRAMGEEAAFNDAQRTQIVEGLCHKLFNRFLHPADEDRREFETLRRLSLRHASWISEWLKRTTCEAKGEDLLRLAALLHDNLEPLQRLLETRNDFDEMAHLLALGPTHPLGQWAYKATSTEAASRWAYQASDADHTIPRAIKTFTLKLEKTQASLARGFSARLVYWASAVNKITALPKARHQDSPHEIDKKTPLAAQTTPSKLQLQKTPAWPTTLQRNASNLSGLENYFSNHFIRSFNDHTATYIDSLVFQLARTHDATSFPWHSIATAHAADSAAESASYLRNFSPTRPSSYSWSLSDTQHLITYSMTFTEKLKKKISIKPSPPTHLKSPASACLEPDLRARDLFCKTTDYAQATVASETLLERAIGEAWYGVVATDGLDEHQRRVTIHRRVQNAWLLHVWPVIDEQAPRNLSPDLLALYLTLGWTQASTTWTWPA